MESAATSKNETEAASSNADTPMDDQQEDEASENARTESMEHESDAAMQSFSEKGDNAEGTAKGEASKDLLNASTSSAAINSAAISTKTSAKTSTSDKPMESDSKMATTPHIIDEEDAKWHTVGIFDGLSATVSGYIDNTAWTSAGLATPLSSDTLPDLSHFQRINLEPGTAYRFRLRAINTYGASDWSEVSSFKTCLPGFPGAPSAIKISKSSEGAHLTWEPPPTCLHSNEIIEYSVYLAVKPAKEKDGAAKAAGAAQRAPAQLAFVRVYVGPANQCTVSHSSLSTAHVDCSNKPAIIFRIAARNEKGYGPATQVRWLQDPVHSAATGAAAAGSSAAGSSLLSGARIKMSSELGGASPSKRFKPSGVGGRGADN